MACNSRNRDFVLSYGAIKKILNGESPQNVFLQILGYKRIAVFNKKCYRLVLNDGLMLYANAILDDRLSFEIDKKKLEKYSILLLKDYALKQLPLRKKIIICTDIETITSGSTVNKQLSLKTSQLSENEENSKRDVSISMTLRNTNQDIVESFTTTLEINQTLEIGEIDQNSELAPNVQNSEVDEVDQTLEVDGIDQNLEVAASDQNLEVARNYANLKVLKLDGTISISLNNINDNAIFESITTTSDIDENSVETVSVNNEKLKVTKKDNNLEVDRVDENLEKAMIDKTLSETYSEIHVLNPISSLHPYRSKWKIKARVIYKTPIFSYKKETQGTYFSFYLLDDSGEIRAVAFNKEIERIYDLLKENKVYLISNAVVQTAKCARNGDFELVINESAKIEQYVGDESTLPMLSFNFQPISCINSLPPNSFTDVIGFSNIISEIGIISTWFNKNTPIRKFILRDKNLDTVTITLWNEIAEEFNYIGEHVIAIRNAKVKYYKYLELSVDSLSMILIDPEIPETYELRSLFHDLYY